MDALSLVKMVYHQNINKLHKYSYLTGRSNYDILIY
jgi:hypothetical protein